MAPVHLVSLWVKRFGNMIKGEAEIERQKSMGYGTHEGSVDWKDVRKTLNFHMCLDVDAHHLEITVNM